LIKAVTPRHFQPIRDRMFRNPKPSVVSKDISASGLIRSLTADHAASPSLVPSRAWPSRDLAALSGLLSGLSPIGSGLSRARRL
jgi:hypothetical protein